MTSPRIRVAFVGKGGAGKSTVSSTFARLLARRGEPVLALDSDPLPGMPYALGIAVDDQPIPDDVVVAGPDGGPRWVLNSALDAETVVNDYAAVCPDGVRYLQFGNLWGHVGAIQRAQHAWSQVVRELDPHRWNLVGDLPGGTRQAMFGWAKYADVVCVVVEPTVKSLHSAARLLRLSEAKWAPAEIVLVANKVTGAADVAAIERRLGRVVAVAVPLDVDVGRADHVAVAPLDAAPSGPLSAAADDLVGHVAGLYPGCREVPP